jgi:AraC-like DNA-binding protein
MHLSDPDILIGPHDVVGLAEDHPSISGGWHHHGVSQLLYATEGVMTLHSRTTTMVLPPQRAAWIPAGVAHEALALRPIRLRTVYLRREGPAQLAVFSVTPLLRESILAICAWGAQPPWAGALTTVMLGLVEAQAATGALPVLPRARTPALLRALELALERIGQGWTVGELAARVGMSERTIQRKAREELGMSVQDWWARARALRAVERLADPTQSVGDVAWACGFETQAAFSRSFRQHFGVSPSQWRDNGPPPPRKA